MKKYKTIIHQYLKGKASPEDRRTVDLWFDSISSDEIDPFTNDTHRERLGKEIFEKIAQKTFHKKVLFLRPYNRFLAAASLIFVVSGLIILSARMITIPTTLTLASSDVGEIKSVILPDSSEVWLDGNSQITYSTASFRKDRKITIDKGRVFFDVKKDPNHPFSVVAGALNIQVLGTSFDVFNSASSGDVRVQVRSGKVRVFNDQHVIENTLEMGESLNYDASTNEIRLENTDVATISLWKEGGLFLHQVNFEELRHTLHNRYGINVSTTNIAIKNLEFSILIPKVQSIDQILEVVSNIHQLKYRRTNNEVIVY